MLPSGCKRLHYTPHAQFFLQPQILRNKEHASCDLSGAHCLTLSRLSSYITANTVCLNYRNCLFFDLGEYLKKNS